MTLLKMTDCHSFLFVFFYISCEQEKLLLKKYVNERYFDDIPNEF